MICLKAILYNVSINISLIPIVLSENKEAKQKKDRRKNYNKNKIKFMNNQIVLFFTHLHNI